MLPKVDGAWKTRGYNLVRVADQWRPTNVGYVKIDGVWKPYYQPAFTALFSGTLHAVDYTWNGAPGRGWGPFGTNSATVGSVTPGTFRNGLSRFSHIGMFNSVRNGIPAKRNLELSLIGGDLRPLASPLCMLNGKVGWLTASIYDVPGDNTYLWYTFAEDVFFSSDEIGDFTFSF